MSDIKGINKTEEEEEAAEQRRKNFCKMLHSEIRSTQDPEHQIENMEVVSLLKAISEKLQQSKDEEEGIDLVPIEQNVIDEDKLVSPPSHEFTEARYEEMKELIHKCLSKLSERERNILCLRYGLRDDYSKTLEEIGMQFEKTRNRIREIEAKALKKMKHPERIKQLHSFFEAKGNSKPKPEALKQLGL